MAIFIRISIMTGGDAEEVERVMAASREIMMLCVDAGGTITGEHGVGADKILHADDL